MICFDNAATAFPKPEAVIRAVTDQLANVSGNAGRGAHGGAMRAAEEVYACRARAADLFGAPSPARVVFTAGATMALNMAVKGSVSPGDHVLLSDLEHNAVFRPVHALARAGKITYDVFPTFAADPTATPERILRGIEKRVRPNTRLLVCTHASNVCSAVLPVREIGALCRARGIRFVVDAAQSAGHLPVRADDLGAWAVCVPGHKGLLGPQGVGMMILGENADPEPILEGGSGVRSLDPAMPPDPPERYEAGTLPLPAIAGLRAGMEAVEKMGLPTVRAHEIALWERLYEQLRTVRGLTVLAPHVPGSVLSFHAGRTPSETVAAALDERGFAVRAGFHCAALAHRTLGTPRGGAVRVSFGPENTAGEVDALAGAIREILARG